MSFNPIQNCVNSFAGNLFPGLHLSENSVMLPKHMLYSGVPFSQYFCKVVRPSENVVVSSLTIPCQASSIVSGIVRFVALSVRFGQIHLLYGSNPLKACELKQRLAAPKAASHAAEQDKKMNTTSLAMNVPHVKSFCHDPQCALPKLRPRPALRGSL